MKIQTQMKLETIVNVIIIILGCVAFSTILFLIWIVADVFWEWMLT
jgi:hypothetical protein